MSSWAFLPWDLDAPSRRSTAGSWEVASYAARYQPRYLRLTRQHLPHTTPCAWRCLEECHNGPLFSLYPERSLKFRGLGVLLFLDPIVALLSGFCRTRAGLQGTGRDHWQQFLPPPPSSRLLHNSNLGREGRFHQTTPERTMALPLRSLYLSPTARHPPFSLGANELQPRSSCSSCQKECMLVPGIPDGICLSPEAPQVRCFTAAIPPCDTQVLRVTCHSIPVPTPIPNIFLS